MERRVHIILGLYSLFEKPRPVRTDHPKAISFKCIKKTVFLCKNNCFYVVISRLLFHFIIRYPPLSSLG